MCVWQKILLHINFLCQTQIELQLYDIKNVEIGSISKPRAWEPGSLGSIKKKEKKRKKKKKGSSCIVDALRYYQMWLRAVPQVYNEQWSHDVYFKITSRGIIAASPGRDVLYLNPEGQNWYAGEWQRPGAGITRPRTL